MMHTRVHQVLVTDTEGIGVGSDNSVCSLKLATMLMLLLTVNGSH